LIVIGGGAEYAVTFAGGFSGSKTGPKAAVVQSAKGTTPVGAGDAEAVDDGVCELVESELILLHAPTPNSNVAKPKAMPVMVNRGVINAPQSATSFDRG
jgi:hypothetical protein